MTAFPDQAADDYDERIVRRVPGYRLGPELAAAVLANRLKGNAHILVAGCGTGGELVELARALPAARFTAIDPSAGMLEQAATKARDHGFADRVKFLQAAVQDAPAETYNAAIAFLVLHFLSDDGAKANFLQTLANRLGDGAPLVLVDPADSSAFDDDYRQWMVQQGLGAEAADNVVTRTKSTWFCVTPERLSALLLQAGFEVSEPFFKAFGYRGIIASRSRKP